MDAMTINFLFKEIGKHIYCNKYDQKRISNRLMKMAEL